MSECPSDAALCGNASRGRYRNQRPVERLSSSASLAYTPWCNNTRKRPLNDVNPTTPDGRRSLVGKIFTFHCIANQPTIHPPDRPAEPFFGAHTPGLLAWCAMMHSGGKCKYYSINVRNGSSMLQFPAIVVCACWPWCAP